MHAEASGATLAERLYVELVGRVMFPAGAASSATKPNPENLAKMCIKLAETFEKARKQSEIDAIPTATKFEVDMSDIAGWDKK
ncbi:MAG: hypothetical protein FJY55_14005 [Betaproteobacteria bacterium]|nr:hypothetical protein [Betaproteobacteria bacterium]